MGGCGELGLRGAGQSGLGAAGTVAQGHRDVGPGCAGSWPQPCPWPCSQSVGVWQVAFEESAPHLCLLNLPALLALQRATGKGCPLPRSRGTWRTMGKRVGDESGAVCHQDPWCLHTSSTRCGESGTTQLPRDGHASTERGRVGLPWAPLCCSILQPAWTSGTSDHLALKPRIILHAGFTAEDSLLMFSCPDGCW